MIYIFIYGIFLLIGIYDIKKKGLLKEKSRNALLNLMILVLTLFRGLRWNTGTDWEQFLEVFQYVDAVSYTHLDVYKRQVSNNVLGMSLELNQLVSSVRLHVKRTGKIVIWILL